ncbi:MAG TPA: glycosyltransferase [Bacteroidia bacterium]|nr:glycosyltransferase [Bacteroidia bacterium]
MKLSILICSLQKRLTQFALLCEHLQNQAQGKPVEILWLGDNKTMSVGEKRNKLLSISKGDYVAFVDDDDWVADDYVDAILRGIEQKKDCICFDAVYSTDEGDKIPVHYSVNNLLNVDEPGKPRLRVPNHLIPIKREYALATKFLEKNFGEDTDYGLRVRRLLKTEYKIDRPMYYYRFSTQTSETHKYSPKYRRPTFGPMVKMDVVIVSDGSVADCRVMTQQAVNSIASPDVNVVVLEKADSIRYANADTFLQRHPFNYNQCLNNGASMGNAEYICFSNNDVVFPEGFVNRIVEEMKLQSLDVLSVTNHKGFIHPNIISGFCFIMRRNAWLKIGKLNTDYRFWCADNVTSEQIKQHNLREGKSDIKVFHGTSITLNMLDAATREEYTRTCVRQFNHDYDRNVLGIGVVSQKNQE